MSRTPVVQNIFSRFKSIFVHQEQSKLTFSAEQVVQRVRLDFPTLALPQPSIHWKENFHLRQLIDLPSNALSGPVQKDKAEAHLFLKRLVTQEKLVIDNFDLRQLYGINHNLPQLHAYSTFADLAAHETCRSIRIIGMRDFQRVADTALAAVNNQNAVQLYGTAWFDNQYFWSSEQHTCALVCAIVYAHRRELPFTCRAMISRATLNAQALMAIQENYHMLAVPPESWTDNAFMNYLVNHKVPYARLVLSEGLMPVEVILLPISNLLSDTFGQGLRLAGATDVCAFLSTLIDES